MIELRGRKEVIVFDVRCYIWDMKFCFSIKVGFVSENWRIDFLIFGFRRGWLNCFRI